jgi:hypothetical protein
MTSCQVNNVSKKKNKKKVYYVGDQMTEKQYGKWLFRYCRLNQIDVTPHMVECLVSLQRPLGFTWGMWIRDEEDSFYMDLLDDIVFITLMCGLPSIRKPCILCDQVYLFEPKDISSEDLGMCYICHQKETLS